MRGWVWGSAVLAPVFLVGGWTLAQTRQPPGYDTARDTISALAAHGAADRWIMTAGLAGLGACHLVTAAGFVVLGRAARGVLALGGAATLAVAAFPQPSPAHAPAAAIAFLALALWPAGTRRCVPAGRWFSLVLLVLLGWFAVTLAAGSLVGLSERAVAAAEALAPLAVALVVRRSARGPASAAGRSARTRGRSGPGTPTP